jgi:DNA-directed RNA polymerase specialized sigma24 family protein
MGGMASKLPDTRWSLILSARTEDLDRQRLAMDNLIAAYWKSIYCYLRRRGYQNEEAKDLTQEFFHKFIIAGKLLEAADAQIGCFRQLLSTAIKRFISNVERDKKRKKRAPKDGMVPLACLELTNLDIPAVEATAEQAFNYAWITSLLDQTLVETKKQCSESDQEIHWMIFHRKVLAPILEGADDISMEDISRVYKLENPNQANSRIVTVKRRFRRILMYRLKDLTGSEEMAEAEFNEIMLFLSKRSARL